MNISGLIARHGRYRGDHVAFVCDGKRLSYADVERRVQRLASGLAKLGLRKGDRIATVTPNCLDLLLLYWVAARAGYVAVPLSPQLEPATIRRLVADCKAGAVLAHVATAETVLAALGGNDLVPKARRLLTGGLRDEFTPFGLVADLGDTDQVPDVEIFPDDLCDLIYAHGGAGEPKAVMISQFARAMYGPLISGALRMTPESIVLQAGSLVSNGALTMMLPAVYLGATFVVLEDFDPDAWIDAVEAEQATHAMLFPSQIARLIANPRFDAGQLGSLACLLTLGAPLPLHHRERVERQLPGCLQELYGITEGFVTIQENADMAARPGSVGSPRPFFELRVVDDRGQDRPAGEIGEIVGRGPIMMSGYHNRPDLTEAAILNGWLRSGDLGYLDEEGFLYLVDRKVDTLCVDGAQVYPRDIEDVIVRHEAVQEAAVFGVRDPQWGDAPIAAVVLHPGCDISAEALTEWVNENVAASYQKVRLVAILEDFPRTVGGKVLKQELREAFRDARRQVGSGTDEKTADVAGRQADELGESDTAPRERPRLMSPGGTNIWAPRRRK